MNDILMYVVFVILGNMVGFFVANLLRVEKDQDMLDEIYQKGRKDAYKEIRKQHNRLDGIGFGLWLHRMDRELNEKDKSN